MYNGYYVHKGKRVDSKSLTDDYVVEPQLYECGVFDNAGATKAISVTLPKALPGRRHSFYVGASYNISIMPQATEVISTSAGAYLAAGIGVKMGTAGARAVYNSYLS